MSILDRFLGRGNGQSYTDNSGVQWHTLLDGKFGRNKITDAYKFELVLNNFVSSYITTLLAELFSMAQVEALDAEGQPLDSHPILDRLAKPNAMSSGSQFLYDYYLFRKIYGSVNMFSPNTDARRDEPIYVLKNHLIEWPKWFTKNRNYLFRTPEEVEALKAQSVKYKHDDNTKLTIFYSELMRNYDVTNNAVSWFEAPSRIDAAIDIIENSRRLLEAKGVNFDFVKRFLVSSDLDSSDITTLGMDSRQKESINRLQFKSNNIYPTTFRPVIERFVNDPAMLGELMEAYKESAFLFGKLYNVPADIIEMLGKSTYENQQQARSAIVEYNCKPDAADFENTIFNHFTEGMEGVSRLRLSWDHLSFMAVNDETKADVKKSKADTFKILVQSGVMPEQAAEYLELPFDEFQKPYFSGANQQGEEDEEPEGQQDEVNGEPEE